jgi:predicted esterase
MKLVQLMLVLLAWVGLATPATSYAPPRPRTIIVQLAGGAGGRTVPVYLTLPGRKQSCCPIVGTILFSHGAYSNPTKYSALIDSWAKSGYAIASPLHADSEAWTGVKPSQQQSTAWRMADMKLALDHLDKFVDSAREGPIPQKPLLIAGHSFGALIAEMFDDPRIKGVIAFSPPGALPGMAAPIVRKPMLTVTGTADIVPMMAPKWEDHLTAHRVAKGPALAYIGTGSDHYFGNLIGRTEYKTPPQDAQFYEAVAISRMFLHAYGPGGANAQKYLKTMKVEHGTIERR